MKQNLTLEELETKSIEFSKNGGYFRWLSPRISRLKLNKQHCKNTHICIDFNDCYVHVFIDFDDSIDRMFPTMSFPFNEYGKTWALTKEELQ